MDVTEGVEFVRGNHRAVLATRRRDGGPQLTPVTVGVDAEGRLLISSRETAYKVKNIVRDSSVSVCVLNDRFFGPWAVLEGRAELVHLPEAMDLLVSYYRDISGEHPDWDDYRTTMTRDQRLIIRVTVERAGPSRHG